ncbi:hypothetical protein RMATCC62417_13916 [Rhizopus microsporus]|nr:hypothetical protein RMATCC62417_13916 [Rhizopus microsporus]
MIWSCFWAGGFRPLVFVDGTVNQEEYINILAERFLPWFINLAKEEYKAFIFQEGGASCHTGIYARWWKQTHAIRSFDYWPAKSPNLNLIEHVWWALGSRLRKVRASIKSVQDLRAALEVEWKRVGIKLAERLAESMRERCQAVIDARGGPTNY